jgi:hypothetical protein
LETYLLFADYEIAFGSTKRQILFENFKIYKYPWSMIKGRSGHIHTKEARELLSLGRNQLRITTGHRRLKGNLFKLWLANSPVTVSQM